MLTVGDGAVVTDCHINVARVLSKEQPAVVIEDGGTMTNCALDGFQPA